MASALGDIFDDQAFLLDVEVWIEPFAGASLGGPQPPGHLPRGGGCRTANRLRSPGELR